MLHRKQSQLEYSNENKLELIPVLLQTQKDYLQQYVEQIDNLLEALLSWQAMQEGSSICHHCDQNMRATWQCKNCMLAMLLCQHCMHVSHRENPLHHIEQWNGSFFWPANLSEVGIYLLVQHHVGEPMCHMLRQWSALLNNAEVAKDNAEQDWLCGVSEVLALASTQPWSASKFEFQSLDYGELEVDNEIAEEEEDSDSKKLHDIAAINAYYVVDGGHNISGGVWPSGRACAPFQTTMSEWSIPMASTLHSHT